MSGRALISVHKVPAAKLWVDTSVWVDAGDTLQFRADGLWVDAFIPCSADGYPASLFYAVGLPPRIPDDGRYFRLMGRVVPNGVEPSEDDPATTFVIGTQCARQLTQVGRLFVFANDRKGFYWNNWGSIRLAISK